MRTALVTGASSGIGAACATRLTRSGWRVFAGVRRSGDAPAGTEELLLDVTDDEQIRAASDRVENLGAYAASKHALEAIADALRVELRPFGVQVSIVEPGTIKTSIWKRSAELAASLADGAPGGLRELYGQRTAAFARVARERGASGASADAVARVVEQALTSERPRTRRLVGRDATIRAGFELLPDRVRDSVYERLLLR